MKKLVLIAAALSMLAAPAAYAQPQNMMKHHRPQAGVVMKKRTVSRTVVHKQPVHNWRRGARLPATYRGRVVADYGHYHLRRPPHGQHWVRVDNQFILVGITSGLIGAIIAAN